MQTGLKRDTIKKIYRIAGIFAPISGILYLIVILYITDLYTILPSTQRPILLIPGILQIIFGLYLYYVAKDNKNSRV